MPYTLHRSGKVLTVLVVAPTPMDVPRALKEIQRTVDGGGISEVHVGFDEAAWQTTWAVCTLTSFETTMRQLGVKVRVLGRDERTNPRAIVRDGPTSGADAPTEPAAPEPAATGRAPARPAG
jgi:hypothetical protein